MLSITSDKLVKALNSGSLYLKVALTDTTENILKNYSSLKEIH